MKMHPLVSCAAVAWLTLAAARVAAAESDAKPQNPVDVAPAIELPAAEAPPSVPRLGPLGESDWIDAEELLATYQDERIVALDDAGGYYSTTSFASGEPYQWQLLPQGLIYRSYLAGVKESRFRSIWHEQEDHNSPWDISLGGNVGLLRYGTRGEARPEGLQLGIEGAGLLRLDRDEWMDVEATDYRFGIPLTWGDAVYQVKFAYYHLSSHVGDEFLLDNPGFNRLNYSRDAFVWGHSLYPGDNWRIYGEIGYAFYIDECDPWEMQFGVDYAPSGWTGARGAPFAAVNAHLREEVNYGGNLVAQAGWAWRRGPASGLYRVGVEYYNGKDDQFSFFDNSVEKIGLGMWYDY